MKEVLLTVIFILSLVLSSLYVRNRYWKNLSIFGIKYLVFTLTLCIAERM